MRGVVYHDVNRNAHRDAGEAGVAGVRVSNGVDIVKTDPQGAYELTIDGDAAIFVLKPRDWMTRVDELNLPRFYYVHKPQGTPDAAFNFKGMGPTGPLPASVDFPLYQRPEPVKFDVLLVGDPQPYDTQEVTWYAREIAPAFRRVNAAFAIALGDLVGDNLDLLEPYNQVNALAGYPFYNVIGNHDLNYMAPTDKHSDATFERVYGPSTYAFQHGRVHFVILNNVYWNGFAGLRKDGWPKRGGYEGRIRDEQLTFIQNYVNSVPRDEAIVVCSHIPMHSPYDDHPGQNTPQFSALLRLLSNHPHTLSFSGHTHFNYNHLAGSDQGYHPAEGTLHLHHNVGTASGSWYHGPRDERGVPFGTMRDGTPRGYAIASFDGTHVSIRFQPFDRPSDHQMAIHVDDVVTSDQTTQVQANVFNASAESVTRMRVVGYGDWIDMQPQRLTDPGYVALYERHAADIEAHPERKEASLPKPQATDHHYIASLPPLTPGLHLIEVETTDRFGQTFRDRRPVRVTAAMDAWKQYDANNIRVPRPGSAVVPSAPSPKTGQDANAPGIRLMPEIIAHRGASHLAPENTLAAINLAWELGSEAAECDVHLSRDGRIVLMHDATTKRTAGVDVPVVEQTYQQLRQLDVGGWKDARFTGEQVPPLEDVIATIPAGKRLFIEVKCGPEIIEPLDVLLQRCGKQPAQTCVISFNWDVVKAMKARRPDLQVYWLSSFKQDKQTNEWSPTIAQLFERAKQAGVDGVDLQAAEPLLTGDAVASMHAAGLQVYAWTVDDPDRAMQLTNLGVDGITTNRPAWLKSQLAKSLLSQAKSAK